MERSRRQRSKNGLFGRVDHHASGIARHKLRAVDGVSIQVREGHSLGVVGESDSGKATLGMAMVRLIAVNQLSCREELMSENVYWTWEADIKPGEEEGFKALAARWAKITAMDPKTLYSNWTISEDGKSVRVDQRFLDSAAAMAQYHVNDCWGQLDNHLQPTSMVICGDYREDLDWLRTHGARFMKLV